VWLACVTGRLSVMPTAITGLGEAGPGRPAPVVSALIEFGSALHVLRDPGHHGASGWAAGVFAGMSERLAARTRAWWWTAQAIRAAPFITAAPPAGDFGASLDRLRAIPASRLASQLLRPVSRSGGAQAALHWSRSREPAAAAVVEALVLRPGEAAADFVGFLERSWQEWFSAEWATIQPVLAARARVFADTVSAQSASAALATVDPSVTVTAPGSVSIAKVQNTRHDVSRRGLLVAPSRLIQPHLYVADVPRRPLLLIHPAEAGPSVPSAADLLQRLGAVAHRGRLEVARAIATEPRTAGEISALWHIDPTLVNRHLRALAAAGLARTARRGRFVQYQLDAAAVEALGTDLLALLLR
jgi:DNA-binding transcriptional ArsR family regulator